MSCNHFRTVISCARVYCSCICVCVCGSDSFNPMVAMALWRNRQKCVCAHFNMIMLFLFNYLSETQLSTIFFPSICCRIDVVVVVVVLCVISEIPIRLAQYHRFRILNRASIVITSSVSIYVSSDSSIDGRILWIRTNHFSDEVSILWKSSRWFAFFSARNMFGWSHESVFFWV